VIVRTFNAPQGRAPLYSSTLPPQFYRPVGFRPFVRDQYDLSDHRGESGVGLSDVFGLISIDCGIEFVGRDTEKIR
jgi:hypothetical protein